jgi:hypothetical protein
MRQSGRGNYYCKDCYKALQAEAEKNPAKRQGLRSADGCWNCAQRDAKPGGHSYCRHPVLKKAAPLRLYGLGNICNWWYPKDGRRNQEALRKEAAECVK